MAKCIPPHPGTGCPSYSIVPRSPSTLTVVPGLSRSSGISGRSIIGMLPMIAPVAMMGSASVFTIAAGAWPLRLRA